MSLSFNNGLIASRPRSSPMASRAAAAVSRVNQSLFCNISMSGSIASADLIRPSAITACFRTNSSLSFKALISPGRAGSPRLTKASVASSMNSSFRSCCISGSRTRSSRIFPSAMIADFRTSQSRRSLSNTSTAGDPICPIPSIATSRTCQSPSRRAAASGSTQRSSPISPSVIAASRRTTQSGSLRRSI